MSLDSDGIYQLSVEDLEEMGLPPSLQSLIQAQLDHLPASLTLLLQCGSVMGAKFTASQLQKLLYSLSYAPTSSKQVLVQLRTLERLNFVHCVAVPHRMHGPEETVWEVSNSLLLLALASVARSASSLARC